MTTYHCENVKLRPCPFCGGEAALIARDTRHGVIGFVECQTCEAQSRVFNVMDFDPSTFDDVAFERAMHNWQRREGGQA